MSWKGGYASWGPGNGTYGGAAAIAAINGKNITNSIGLTRKATVKEIPGENGDTKLLKATNKHFEIAIVVVPTSTADEATADGLVVLPAHLEEVTLSGFKHSQVNGVWYVFGDPSMTATQGTEVTINITLRRYEQGSLPAQS